MDRYYPQCAPEAHVSPHEDLSGDIEKFHIYSDGKICYMHESEWDPRIHNLSFVFSQSKLIVSRAIELRAGSPWKGSFLNQMLY